MNAEKVYIGKGKVKGLYGNVEVVINIEEATPHMYEYKGEKYLKFSLGKMKVEDKFGRSHTAFLTPFVVKSNEEIEAQLKLNEAQLKKDKARAAREKKKEADKITA